MKPHWARKLTYFTVLTAVYGVSFGATNPAANGPEVSWPRFRGPDGNGVCALGGLPAGGDLQSTATVAWKTATPLRGFSSPVVWGDRVFLTGGDESQCAVMCFDAGSGKLLWSGAAPKAKAAAGEVPEQSGMAASTPATDGQRIYAIFANGQLVAFDFNGALVWSKNLGFPKNPYGYGTSLLTWEGRVIVQYDQGEAKDGLSKVLAFDGASGAEAWSKPRPVGASWATPIICQAAGKAQIITLADPWVIAYSAADGAEIWRANCLEGEVTPSPIFSNGTVFVVSPTHKLQAIRPDGQGDVTKSHLGWVAEDGIPEVTSPVSNGHLVFLIDSNGMLTCYDAKDGKKQWENDFSEEFQASPSLAGQRLCLITKKGTLIAVEPGREFKEVGRFAIGEEVTASPAFSENRMFVRSAKHLICIGTKASARTP